MTLNWSGYRTAGAFPPGYPDGQWTYFSPADGPGIHKLIVDLINSTTHSCVLNMYGFDDDDANAALLKLTTNPNVYFQMSLDKSQSGGVHEKALLAKWNPDMLGNSIAIGQSVKHAISHLKVMVVDGLYVVSGSTNWSLSGEEQQDNQITVTENAVLAAQYRTVLDLNHTAMLKQMAASGAPTH